MMSLEPPRRPGRLQLLVAVRRPLIQDGLERWIAKGFPDADVVAMASMEDVAAHLTLSDPRLVLAEPDVLLEIKSRLKCTDSAPRLLLISASNHAGLAQSAQLTCACGHLSDGASYAMVLDAITLAAGCRYANRASCGTVACALKSTLLPMATGLSSRQAEVFVLMGEGQQAKVIAQRLSISVKTVETYREQIKQRFGLPDSRSLLQFAIVWRRDSGTTPQMFLDQRADSHLAAKSSADSG